uniref:Uncharacterized protein n=1 Tax=Panagrolaimus sp. ES5 TaxID=591445 RepID=A0AC34FU93_9BILA
MASRKRKSVKLIAFDIEHNLEYQGKCKLVINIPSKMLSVEPKDEKFKMKSALFKWKFHAEKENDNTVTKEILEERFLIPIFTKINVVESFAKMQKIINRWILSHDEVRQQKYLQLLKKFDENNGIHKNADKINDNNIAQENGSANARKRRYHERINAEATTNNHKNDTSAANKNVPIKKKTIVSPEYFKVIPSSQFKMVTVKIKLGFQRRLSIFSSLSDKTKCYEYTCNNQKYFCRGCREKKKTTTAILDFDAENGEQCIKLEAKSHVCTPIPYQPEIYNEIQILQKPEYQFFDNCSTQSGRKLFVFNPNDPNMGYEYFWKSLERKFFCWECHKNKKDTTAEICNESKENEYIQLLHSDHVCEFVKYEPEKYTQLNNFVIKPNFEIQTKIQNGRKILIIFDENDKSLCYRYFFSNSKNVFQSAACREKNKNVSAKLCQNSDGEEYVILSNAQHVCSLRKYFPQTKDYIIIRPPQMKLTNNNQLIFIFTSEEVASVAHIKCYIFSPASKKDKRYVCNGCKNILKSESRKCKKNKESKCVVYGYLSRDDSKDVGGYSFQMIAEQKHFCKPQKYEPEKISNIAEKSYVQKQIQKKKNFDGGRILRLPNFELQRSVTGVSDGKLVVFKEDDRSFCYNYYLNTIENIYVCSKCCHMKTRVRANMNVDEKTGEKYVILGNNEHVCEPSKYEPEENTIKDSNFMIFNQESERKTTKLVVFTSPSKEFCHVFVWINSNRLFMCQNCNTLKKKVSAKIQKDENGHEFVQLFKNGHICQPKKFILEEFQPKIIPKSGFIQGVPKKVAVMLLY